MKPTLHESVQDILTRGVMEVIDRPALERMLTSGKKLRVKLGVDPTAPDLHIGHAVIMRKLRAFQKLGHKVVFIIGDFTGQIGDPSGKSKTRPTLTEAEVKKNEKSYLKQAGLILDLKKSEVHHNSEWYKKGGLKTLLQLTASASIQQVLKREDFKQRLASGGDVTILETLYPLLQGYDSVAIKADIELGGQDQLLNLLMGRRVQRHFGLPEQQILTTGLLEGLDGVHKMSKSLGNYVGLTDKPEDMFGKLMSVPDVLMPRYAEMCTELSTAEFEALAKELSPRDLKARLASEITTLYHGAKAAKAAEEKFDKLFSKKEWSSDVPELKLKVGSLTTVELVLAAGLAKSKSEAWRLVEQGGLKIGETTKNDPRARLVFQGGESVKIGKKNFFRIKI